MRKHAMRWILGALCCLPFTTWIVGAAAPRPATPAAPAAQKVGALSIDHKPVACIIAEQHPQLDACFAPADNLARARVFFRAGGTPHWYFVEMKPKERCFVGTLLKPKKAMIGQNVDLYVEAVAKNLESGRTPEYAAKVVASASDCRRDLPVAAWVPKASVAVGSEAGAAALPPGFAAAGMAGGGGGISATAITFGAIGGAGAVTGLAVALSSGSSSTPTPIALAGAAVGREMRQDRTMPLSRLRLTWHSVPPAQEEHFPEPARWRASSSAPLRRKRWTSRCLSSYPPPGCLSPQRSSGAAAPVYEVKQRAA
jgi:hypothetical protein